jgi:hypothetical protein
MLFNKCLTFIEIDRDYKKNVALKKEFRSSILLITISKMNLINNNIQLF